MRLWYVGTDRRIESIHEARKTRKFTTIRTHIGVKLKPR